MFEFKSRLSLFLSLACVFSTLNLVSSVINAEEPKPTTATVVEAPAPVVQLSPDELEFVHAQYRATVIETAIGQVYKVENDSRSGAITSIKLASNEVVTLILAVVFKGEPDFENQRFEAIYKAADERNKVRVWDAVGEGNWLRKVLTAYAAKDEKFTPILAAASKMVMKEAAKSADKK